MQILLDAGPQITDINTGAWASVLIFLLFVAIGLLLWSFFRRFNRAKKAAESAGEYKNKTNKNL